MRTISQIYFWTYRIGILRNSPYYENHYFARNFIKEGDAVLDIGANLGYYTILFSNWVGKEGKVYAVEPVELYVQVLQENLYQFSKYPENVVLFPFALGAEEKEIIMEVPVINGLLSQGRSHVAEILQNEEKHCITFRAKIQKPQRLFKEIQRLDYIKIDTEGYELIILKEMMDLIRTFKPILFIESDKQNSPMLFEMLASEGYSFFYLVKKKLFRVVSSIQMPLTGYEFYAVHTEKLFVVNKFIDLQ